MPGRGERGNRQKGSTKGRRELKQDLAGIDVSVRRKRGDDQADEHSDQSDPDRGEHEARLEQAHVWTKELIGQ